MRDSHWDISTITIDGSHSFSATSTDGMGRLTGTATGELAFSHTYHRVAPNKAETIYGGHCTDGGEILDKMLPGEFCLLDRGTVNFAEFNSITFRECCCPCRPVLLIKPIVLDSDSLPDGTYTFTTIDPDGATPPEVTTQEIYVTEEFDIKPKYCRAIMPHPDSYEYESPRVDALIEIARRVAGGSGADEAANEEQTILLTGGKVYFGTADLRWTDLEGTIFRFRMSAPNLLTDDHGLPFARCTLMTIEPLPGTLHPDDEYTLTPVDPDIFQVTCETHGLRVCFLGPYAGAEMPLFSVHSSEIEHHTSLELNLINQANVKLHLHERAGAEYHGAGDLFVPLYDVPGHCPKNYSGSAEYTVTLADSTLHTTAGQTWG